MDPRETLWLLGMSQAMIAWAAGRRSLEEVWQRCPSGEWLLAFAAAAGAPRAAMAAAAADCAALAVAFVPKREPLPAATVERVRAWARGEIGDAEAWAAGFRAAEVARSYEGVDPRARDGARAAADAAFACDRRADERWYAARCYPARVARLCAGVYDESSVDAGSICAEYVRAQLEWEDLARSLPGYLARRSEPPPVEAAISTIRRRTGFEEFEGSGLVRGSAPSSE